MNQIGKPAWPIDWEDKTSGKTAYLTDVLPEGTLFGVILRSPYPYAKIRSVDVSRAEAMPGVKAVVTAADFRPDARYFHEMCFDRTPLADDFVRFVGQEVAAVAATSRQAALEALAVITVDYEPMDAPMTAEAALAPGATLLHQPGPPLGMAPPHDGAGGPPPEEGADSTHEAPAGHGEADGPPADAAGDHGVGGGDHPPMPSFPNVRRGIHTRLGAFEEASGSAEVKVSGTYRFGRQTHVCMETNRTLAKWAEDGRLHYWSSTAVPRYVMFESAGIFGMPPQNVAVHEVAVGGSFGSKITITDHEVIAAQLARKANAPVLIALTREEEFSTTKSRHPFEIDLTIGADRSGKVKSLEARMRVESGAFLHNGASVMGASVGPLITMYRFEGAAIDALLIDTAMLPAGAYRGYGAPQTTFALESLMDDLAKSLGMDPVELRVKNAYRSGDQGLGSSLGSVGLADCFSIARDAIDWHTQRAAKVPGIGLGIAGAEEVSGAFGPPGSNVCEGEIELHPEGRCVVRFGGCDAGTGQRTILAQTAAEELGIPLECVSVISMDTDATPHDLGPWSSRGTHYTVHAIRQTAIELAAQIKEHAASRLGDDVVLVDGKASSPKGEAGIFELVASHPALTQGYLAHKSTYFEFRVEALKPDGTGKFTATHNFGAHAAKVDVDTKTGQVRVVDYVAVTDSGTVLNPLLFDGQVRGGVVQGLGGALGEELIFEQGKLVNPALLHYAMPRAADVPRIRTITAPAPDEAGPYGAKAVGENSILPPGPVIANAVEDAVGVRITSLPITPDKVLTALARKQGRSRSISIISRPGRWWIGFVRALYSRGLLKRLHARQMTLHDQAVAPPAPLRTVDLPTKLDAATRVLSATAVPVGGNTDLQLLRRQNIRVPEALVATTGIAELEGIDHTDDGSLSIGAATTLAELSAFARDVLPALHEAIEGIASPQVRNVATLAGNLRQAKRCWFYRNGFNCYKRRGGLAPCYAIEGDHRFYHAVIDGHRCQAVTPSDLSTILSALDAELEIANPRGSRRAALIDLYTGPGEMDGIKEDELIVRAIIPATALKRQTGWRKLNLWQGDFAIASSAVSLALDAQGQIKEARVVLGAIAPVPWRARKTEAALIGRRPDIANLRELLDQELDRSAHPLARNEWKLDAVAGLTERVCECLSQKSSD